MLRAFVAGPSGAVGKALMAQLRKDKRFAMVKSLGRREYKFGYEDEPEEPERGDWNEQVVVDYENLTETLGEQLTGLDVGFCCLGTTRKQAGSDEAFRRVDYDYVLEIAKLAKAQGVKRMLLVSSIGADASSWFLYPRTKGQIENALTDLSFEHLVVYRPSVLDRGVDTRFVEKVSVPFMNLFNKYQVMPVGKLASVMIKHAVAPPAEAVTILENPAIHNAA